MRARYLVILFAAAGLVPAACDGSTPVVPLDDDDGGTEAAPPPPPAEAAPPQEDAGVDAPAEAAVDAAPPFDCSEDSGDGIPTHLYCTGLYGDWGAKTPASGVRPYTPGLVFWSDGAQKSRWMYIPPGTKIDTTDMDEWSFPVGFKVWKEFKLGKRVETRLFWKRGASDWARTTYRWKDDESDALRFEDGTGYDGGSAYEIPDVLQCDTCHMGRKDKMLGIEAIGLAAPGGSGVTLATLVQEGLLTSPPAATSVRVPNDATGKAADALAYIHVNCGTACHNRNPSAQSFMTGLFMRLATAQTLGDAGTGRAEDTDTYVTAVNVKAVTPPWSTQGLYRIKPGDLTNSLVATLPNTRTTILNGQMPPIVTHQIDDAGVGTIQSWVQALP
jgi:hypothetical protein